MRTICAAAGLFFVWDRDPTLTELRVLDTWSDHCRHTTHFNTVIDEASFEDSLLQRAWQDYLDTRASLGRTKPICLMDLATVAVKALKKAGHLPNLDESEEINACTVKISVDVDGVSEPWLTAQVRRDHPTRRLNPSAAQPTVSAWCHPRAPVRAFLCCLQCRPASHRRSGPPEAGFRNHPRQAPQRKLVTTAAAGYSSYGNQIGLATGIVDELYHPGYAAKRMEIGAVIAAAPAENVIRKRPVPGDVVILLGGSTGRDGIGGATGSSAAHNAHSSRPAALRSRRQCRRRAGSARLFRNPVAST